jgi:hypothetical protein
VSRVSPIVLTVCAVFTACAAFVAPAGASVPNVSWTVIGARCVKGVVNLDIKITDAVVGQSYAIYGTSGYRASNEQAVARTPAFTTTFTPNEAYGSNDSAHFSVTGDLEAPAIHQVSQVRTVNASCPTGPTSQARVVLPTGASATQVPSAASLAAQPRRTASHVARNVVIAAILVAVLLAVGAVFSRRRWNRRRRRAYFRGQGSA